MWDFVWILVSPYFQPLFQTKQQSQDWNLGDRTSPHDFIDVDDGFHVADYVTYKSVGIVMHNLCIFKIIESWQLSHNEAKIADLQKSTNWLT